MIPFHSEDPYPILPWGSYSYDEAKEHAAQVDAWLGFQIEDIESKLTPPDGTHETWNRLSAQAFQTPYVELRSMLALLEPKDGDLIVDLGSAYSRMAFVIGRHYPGVHFHGFELVPERTVEAQRVLAPFHFSNVTLETRDLSSEDFRPPEAEIYFLFDYGHADAIRKTLTDLQSIARRRAIQVVARGRGSRHHIQSGHPWLAEVNPPRHFDHFSIYRS